jgi:hypothetical protein
MNEETVGTLLGCLSNCGFAEVHGCGESADVTGVADLQAIQRFRRVSDVICDPEIVIEKTSQRVQAHSRHRNHSIEAVTRLSTSASFTTRYVTIT